MNDELNLIPYPAHLTRQAGCFPLAALAGISAGPQTETAAGHLRDMLAREIGLTLAVRDCAARNCISLRRTPSGGCEESYTLKIEPEGVALEAPSDKGILYAAHTLMQIFLQFGPEMALPCLTIEDRPRFAWRGLMLDEGRHFQGMAQVKRLLDIMARLKLNTFHWHLTEDQGWRIEIERYPRLTEIGSRRAGTGYGSPRQGHNHIPHEGFYSQDEIREVVAYAAARNITIVPEIEIPGHSNAALAAYPEYSCTGGPFAVGTHWGWYYDVYCAGKEKAFEFLQNVLDEVIGLFPGNVLHIGGDEAPRRKWKQCPDCRRRALELGTSIDGLQTYFSNRIAAFLQERGRRAIGWSEILQPGLTETAMVQYWLHQPEKIVAAMRQGRDVIMTPMTDLYLDYTYALIPLRHLYYFEPVFPALSAADAAHVKGIEVPLWTEFVWNQARLDYQLFPRLLAAAEIGWTEGRKKDYAGFETRLTGLLGWLDANGVAYAPRSEWNPPQWKHSLALLGIDGVKNRTAAGPVPFPE